jgi:hypothetical protein
MPRDLLSSLLQGAERPDDLGVGLLGGRDRRRSGDLALFRRALCQLSYPTADDRLASPNRALGKPESAVRT